MNPTKVIAPNNKCGLAGDSPQLSRATSPSLLMCCLSPIYGILLKYKPCYTNTCDACSPQLRPILFKIIFVLHGESSDRSFLRPSRCLRLSLLRELSAFRLGEAAWGSGCVGMLRWFSMLKKTDAARESFERARTNYVSTHPVWHATPCGNPSGGERGAIETGG